jgi:hypothetical protein
MQTLALKRLARFAPLVAVLGCADQIDPTSPSPDELGTPTDVTDEPGGGGVPADASLDIEFFHYNSSCEVAGWDLETAVTRADGTFVGNPECHFVFDDGTTTDLCNGFVELTPGMRSFHLTVRDPVTGAMGTYESGGRGVDAPLALTLEASSPACLSIAWAATVSPPTLRILTIAPSENVLADQPLSTTGEVAVREPGAYEVMLFAEDERSTGPICTARVGKRVAVEACPPPPPVCE